ncbi:PREDICTED: aminopeptidase N-like [Trachymyrmex cornetzi]|uniref:aminopeptidase N-like n=1 Tax=Trachymyrmex cornetzi TaxID=471704 RepID=UPI00084F0502|nr:PREDICTED: aminopeptidase N-like [Trachymyrmex cornetzi]
MSIMINGMTFLKLLLQSNLIFFITTTIVTGKNSKHDPLNHLPQHIIALHYDIKITLPMTVENYIFYGKSNINIIVRDPTQQIDLHSAFVNVNEPVKLIHEITKKFYLSSTYSCRYLSFICSLFFNELITIGSYILELKYNGTIISHENVDGFIITSYKDGEQNLKWIYSAGDFQNTIGVQYVFPVISDLMFKATFDIIVDHPKHYTALSNMPVASIKIIKAGVIRSNFRTTPAIHPYHVAIIVADLITLYSKKAYVPLLYSGDLTIARQLYFALNVAENTTIYLKDKYFQNMNNISQTNCVAIPYYRDDGLPNLGLILYSQEAISYIEELNSIQRKTEVAALVARKVANQFLNKITLSSWSDIWINEGIATFLGMHVVDKIFTDLQIMDLFVVWTRCESLHLESVTNMPSIVFQIKEPYDIKFFSSFRYNKEHLNNLSYTLIIVAFALLRMLYHMISDEVFRKGICNYLNNQVDHIGNIGELQHSSNVAITLETLHQCCCNLRCCMSDVSVKSTPADDLWAVMQTALNESNHKNGLNIKKMMNFWITQDQYPILKATRNYNDGSTVIWAEIHNISKLHEWLIPVTYTTQTELNFNITPFFQEWITSEQSFIHLPSIDVNDWIIVNLQQLGYYRVMYDRKNWLKLASYLNSDKYNKIHVVNRAQIIDDAYYFFMRDQLGCDIFKELTQYLSQETDYIPWYPMFNIFRNILNYSNIFSHPEASSMKEHMRKIMYDLLEKIGYVNRVNDNIHIISLREEAAEWACFFGDDTCRKRAYKELQDYMTLVTKHKWLFIADFQGVGVRQIFPCWDEPNIRNFTIFIKHGRYRALSDTKVTNMFSVKHEKNWTRFKPTVKIFPHNVLIVLHGLKQVNDSNIWCREQVKQNMTFLQSIAKNTALYLKLKLEDIIHPQSVTHVVVPGFLDSGKQSWGIILYRETDVLYDEKLDFIAWKLEVAFMIARKIAHEYVGNLIAQPSWFHFWLNEGIATFMAMKTVDQHFSTVYSKLMDLFDVKFQHESLRLNDYYNMSLIYEIDTPSDIDSIFSLTHYIKAPVFIRSLDKILPDDILRISIDDYISKHKFKSIDTKTTALEKFFAAIKYNLMGDESNYMDVMKIFTQWTKQERYPVLKVQRIPFQNKFKIYVVESCPENFPIPVTYIEQRNPYVMHNAWLNKPDSDLFVYIYDSDWIIVNIQQTGYYRVNYDDDLWQKLGVYLNLTEYFNIQVLNRAQIIDDAYYFLSTNKLDFKLFKTLTYYLSKETDYIAWYPMFKILEQMSGFFPFLQSFEVKEHFRKILVFLLCNIGYVDLKNDNDFTKCLRHEAVKWACVLNSQECMVVATFDLIRLYEKSKLHQTFPGWKEWTYCKGIMKANNITWNKVLNEKKTPLNNQLLEFLACSKSDTIIIGYINLLKLRYFTDVKQCIVIFHSIIAKHIDNDLVFKYILQNFEEIVPR